MSKGSLPRPYSVDLNTFNNNWDNIFCRPDPKLIEEQQHEDEEFERIANQFKLDDNVKVKLR